MAHDVSVAPVEDPGTRTFAAEVNLGVLEATTIEYQGTVAQADGLTVADELNVTLDGEPIAAHEIVGPHGGRIHRIPAGPGQMRIRYSAEVTGSATKDATKDATDEYQRSLYLRPSRFIHVDRIFGYAAHEFGSIAGDAQRALAVRQFVADRLDYLPGASTPYDGAAETLLASAGVCRDYAHLTIALLRAVKLPARMTAVFAPGCDPMDFHAVAEVLIDDTWYVLDGTALAPRASMVRIASGRDAADIAFLDNHGGAIRFDSVQVTAITDRELPVDDPATLVAIA